MRKVPYRIGGTNRLRWGVILAERQGLSLLFIHKPDEDRPHSIVVATENVAERIFEDVSSNCFPIEHEDLVSIGRKLQALGDDLSEEEFFNFFNREED